MNIFGHKTWSVFDLYNIINDQDLKEAAKKHEIYLKTKTNSSAISSERGVIIPLQHVQGTLNAPKSKMVTLWLIFSKKKPP